jgi:signal transduction histidine kinase
MRSEMMNNDLDKLAELIEQERQPLLTRWRQQVRELPSARQLDSPTLDDHIPDLLAELAMQLRSKSVQTIPEALSDNMASTHGRQRLRDAFDIEEVVAEYNVLRGCIHDLADDRGLNLQGKPFRTINKVFDHAIGSAVQAFATQRALEVQRRREEHLAFVAHDLRTPLNAISLAGRVLELTFPEGSNSAETVQMFKALRRGVHQLEGLVAMVLKEGTNLQTETGIKLERREFDLWPFVEALIHDLKPVAGTASTRLTNKVPVELVVYADADLLSRIIQNLIANAIKYTPRGEVIIGARERGAEEAVECWVSDNGAGIPEEFLEKVFDKGETDSNSEGGMGLGLAIVKTFTEAHGGQVSVKSEEGAGSTFRFSLLNKAAVSGPGK